MKNEFQKRVLTILFIAPLSFYFIFKGSFFFITFLFILFLISSYEWLKMTKMFFLKAIGLSFLIISFLTAFYIRAEGLEFFLFIIIICISNDIGGYFFGKFFKGPKLSKISPNKTYSGMLGGILLAIFFSYLLELSSDFEIQKNLSNTDLVIIVLIISSISQIGDLIISFFKRICKIKNTGNILPGHGGLLDRIDGMIFVFPSVFLLLFLI